MALSRSDGTRPLIGLDEITACRTVLSGRQAFEKRGGRGPGRSRLDVFALSEIDKVRTIAETIRETDANRTDRDRRVGVGKPHA